MDLSERPKSRATVTVGGTATANEDLYARFELAATKPPVIEVSYPVQGNDTPQAMASGLAKAINGDAGLQKAGVTATADGPKITVLAQPPINLADSMTVFPHGTSETIVKAPNTTSVQQQPASGLDTAGIRDLLFTLLGVVATGWATIIGYYFGSSSGSAQKSLILANALTQKGEDGLGLSVKVPSITGIDPKALTRSPNPQSLTLHGKNLDGVTIVRLSKGTSTLDATVDRGSASPTSIKCSVLVPSATESGDWDVTVSDAGGIATKFPQQLKIN